MKMPEPLLKFFSHRFDHSTYDITAKEVMDIGEKAAVLEMSHFEDKDKSHNYEAEDDNEEDEEDGDDEVEQEQGDDSQTEAGEKHVGKRRICKVKGQNKTKWKMLSVGRCRKMQSIFQVMF